VMLPLLLNVKNKISIRFVLLVVQLRHSLPLWSAKPVTANVTQRLVLKFSIVCVCFHVQAYTIPSKTSLVQARLGTEFEVQVAFLC